MKRIVILALILFSSLIFSSKQADLDKLTGGNKDCRGCDLSEERLEGVNLSDVDFSGANLARTIFGKRVVFSNKTNFEGAHLEGAQFFTDLKGINFKNAHLQGAFLTIRNLSGAVFENADLSGANLLATNVSGANFKGADLTGANLANIVFSRENPPIGLDDAKLGDVIVDKVTQEKLDDMMILVYPIENYEDFLDRSLKPTSDTVKILKEQKKCPFCNLEGAELNEVDLTGKEGLGTIGAKMQGANLSKAKLQNANLKNSNLIGVNLIEANLAGANLTGATLIGTNLGLADLTGANFEGATLIGVDLRKTKLSGTAFNETIITADMKEKDWYKGLTAEQKSGLGTKEEIKEVKEKKWQELRREMAAGEIQRAFRGYKFKEKIKEGLRKKVAGKVAGGEVQRKAVSIIPSKGKVSAPAPVAPTGPAAARPAASAKRGKGKKRPTKKSRKKHKVRKKR